MIYRVTLQNNSNIDVSTKTVTTSTVDADILTISQTGSLNIPEVTLQNNSNIDVLTETATTSTVDVDTSIIVNQSEAGNLTLDSLQDIDNTNKTNNSILIYNASLGKYIHVDPSEILDRADGVNDDSLDYGSY